MSNGRPWTGDDTARLRRLVASGMGDAEIAEEMDRDRTLIVRKRHEHRIPRGISVAMAAALARLRTRRPLAA